MGFLKKIKKSKKGSSSSSSKLVPAAAVEPSTAPRINGGTNGHHQNGHGGSNGYANHPQDPHSAAQQAHPHHSPHRGMAKEHQHHRHHGHHHHHTSNGNGYGNSHAAQESAIPANPTLSMLPSLLVDLERAPTASSDGAALALRTLFALSEHSGGNSAANNRTAMVRDGPGREGSGRLVPVLLDFLRRCDRGSSEQYLALLVLNNISIPGENKRLIAVDCGGAHLLARLLCIDPSCHLIAIILVNLSFADADLRRELVAPSSPVQLVDALSYALLMATLSPEEFAERPPLIDPDDHDVLGRPGGEEINLSPRKLLAAAMAEDRKYRPSLTAMSYAAGGGGSTTGGGGATTAAVTAPFDVRNLMYVETVRWCLCALKNVTRNDGRVQDSLAAHSVMDAAILPLVLRVINVRGEDEVDEGNGILSDDGGERELGPSGGEACSACNWNQDIELDLQNIDPSANNNPSGWDANSPQDAALFTLLNMSSIAAARPYLRELDAVKYLASVTKAASKGLRGGPAVTELQKLLAFQCLKARMAAAFLLASEGHFGQNRASSEATAYLGRAEQSAMLTTQAEAVLLVELLANTLHQRAKEGAGGYSAATFSVKGVLSAIRCLLTSPENQVTITASIGTRLNALLLLALAQHAIRGVPAVDSEAAEHACFSLYLLSNYGFKRRFLPAQYSHGNQVDKIFTTYSHAESVTPAGRHAASQLLLRLRYLIFEGDIEDDMEYIGRPSDYALTDEIMRDLQNIIVEKRAPGAAPNDQIFDRPILRSRAPRKGTEKAPWDNSSSVARFPNALLAVQDMSFGSTKVRHLGSIDDVQIANNVAKSASGEKAIESYNYWWKWQPDKNANGGSPTKNGYISSFISRASSGNDAEPLSIFGFQCCAADATI